jgi:hypothetical protein
MITWGFVGILALLCSLVLSLNTVVVIFLAMLHGGKITLDFNRYHEGWPELALCILVLAFGIFGIIKLTR